MANSHAEISPSNIGEYLKENQGWVIGLGILLTVLGLLALGFSIAATIISVSILGVILFAVGVTQIIEGIRTHKWRAFFLHFLVGVLYVISGGIMFLRPGISAVSLTLVLSIFYAFIGLFRMISSGVMRFRQWGWVFFNGFISLIIGVMIFLSWPVSGIWIIGLFAGIDLLIYGASIIALAIAIRKPDNREQHERTIPVS
jgi:uncharacterized membrane protein HdeD (DUF308 family)